MNDRQIQDLKRIKSLLDNGVLNQEEFDAEKAKIIGGGNNTEPKEDPAIPESKPSEAKPAHNKSKKKFIIGIVVAVILIIILTVVCTLYNHGYIGHATEPVVETVDETQQSAITKEQLASAFNLQNIDYGDEDFTSEEITDMKYSPDGQCVFAVVEHTQLMSGGDWRGLYIYIISTGQWQVLCQERGLNVVFNDDNIDVSFTKPEDEMLEGAILTADDDVPMVVYHYIADYAGQLLNQYSEKLP